MKLVQVTAHRAAALALAAVVGLALGADRLADAQTFTVLYSFAGYPTDGAGPEAGLLMDASGNLYGTTTFGGNVNGAHCGGSGYIGCGTVFELDTNGMETVLHNFAGPDGANPRANLIMDAKGGLYGTTVAGGTGCVGETFEGCGLVFKLSGGKETVLHYFTGGKDGKWPMAGVIADASGALYGTTYLGGKFNDGAVFKLVGTKEIVLHSFTGGKDGGLPAAGLLMDTKGNLFGTTTYGGDINCDYPYPCGVVFELAGTEETVLHAFKGSPDGNTPAAALFMDARGNLYGTTVDGGNSYNLGTVFEVRRGGTERILYRFGPPLDHAGARPQSRVIRDAEGNLYGTTEEGGLHDSGIVFEISKDGKKKVLHNFCSTSDCSDGAYPNDLIMDAKGNLYGTAFGGGVNKNGTVFMITAPPSHPQ